MIKKHSIMFGAKKLYSIQAIADMSGYSAWHIRRLAQQGKIAGQKVGPRIWWFDKNLVLFQLSHQGTLSVADYEKSRTARIQELRDMASDL